MTWEELTKGCGAAQRGLCKSEWPEPLLSRCEQEEIMYGEGFKCPRELYTGKGEKK